MILLYAHAIIIIFLPSQRLGVSRIRNDINIVRYFPEVKSLFFSLHFPSMFVYYYYAAIVSGLAGDGPSTSFLHIRTVTKYNGKSVSAVIKYNIYFYIINSSNSTTILLYSVHLW